jgi:hypothetical protein
VGVKIDQSAGPCPYGNSEAFALFSWLAGRFRAEISRAGAYFDHLSAAADWQPAYPMK